MASLGIAFQLSASATGMAQGINAGVVELQKLGYAAKQTARDVSTLKTLEISRAFISGVSAIANTFQQFTSGALNSVDSTRQFAASLGVSYQELRTLQVAADLSGASTEELAKAFTKAQVTISKAASGSKDATKLLDALGLSVAELSTQTSTQQLQTIAAAINSIENPAQRAAAAVGIFGRSGAELLPTFRELPENLQAAQQFLEGFKGGLTQVDADKIDSIGDSFSLATQAMQELASKILVELQPALTQGAADFVTFLQGIDVPAAARTLGTLLEDVANALSFAAQAARPLAENLLPSLGAGLAFINRQAIGGAITGLATAFTASARAALGYATAAGAAATATAGLAVTVRGLLASTGLGALVVVLGLAAGALVEWALSADASGADTSAAIAGAEDTMRRFRDETDRAGVAAFNLGEEVKKALKVPEEISVNEFAQGSLNEARSAIVQLAKELGGLDKVPSEVLANFKEIGEYAAGLDPSVMNLSGALGFVDRDSRKLIGTIRELTEQRKKEADAAKDAADAARKAAEESRKRVAELATQGLSAAEQSRLKLNQDLLAIGEERRAAELALAESRKAGDRQAIIDANKRLRLVQQASDEAKAQARERQLQALGINEDLLKPAKQAADQFKAVRAAFDRGLIDGGQARNALRNLAAEGVEIRRDIAAELSRPAQQALQISDLRSQEGIGQFLAAATGREDPAIAQRREQLTKLEQIRQAIAAVGANPVDLLGG
jgi:hypothetical protein